MLLNIPNGLVNLMRGNHQATVLPCHNHQATVLTYLVIRSLVSELIITVNHFTGDISNNQLILSFMNIHAKLHPLSIII